MNKEINTKQLKKELIQAIFDNQNPLDDQYNSEQNDKLEEKMKDKRYCIRCVSHNDHVQDNICKGCLNELTRDRERDIK